MLITKNFKNVAIIVLIELIIFTSIYLHLRGFIDEYLQNNVSEQYANDLKFSANYFEYSVKRIGDILVNTDYFLNNDNNTNYQPKLENYLTHLFNNYEELIGITLLYTPEYLNAHSHLVNSSSFAFRETNSISHKKLDKGQLYPRWYFRSLQNFFKHGRQLSWHIAFPSPGSNKQYSLSTTYVMPTSESAKGVIAIEWSLDKVLQILQEQQSTSKSLLFFIDGSTNKVFINVDRKNPIYEHVYQLPYIKKETLTDAKNNIPIFQEASISGTNYFIALTKTPSGIIIGSISLKEYIDSRRLSGLFFIDIYFSIFIIFLLSATIFAYNYRRMTKEKAQNKPITKSQNKRDIQTSIGIDDEIVMIALYEVITDYIHKYCHTADYLIDKLSSENSDIYYKTAQENNKLFGHIKLYSELTIQLRSELKSLQKRLSGLNVNSFKEYNLKLHPSLLINKALNYFMQNIDTNQVKVNDLTSDIIDFTVPAVNFSKIILALLCGSIYRAGNCSLEITIDFVAKADSGDLIYTETYTYKASDNENQATENHADNLSTLDKIEEIKMDIVLSKSISSSEGKLQITPLPENGLCCHFTFPAKPQKITV
ncbi:hypothetical protein [Zooshikella ganghwensis]|uniref:hypothetical protein n=1 Tax=Zooshikella ganghwensis TaxID=202772 RepID=UPI00041144D6|nr:hypothetical protein [Zooshikella ganghwensis]